MAASFTLEYFAQLTGLGANDSSMSGFSTLGQTATAVTHQYRTIATTNVAEALDLGDVATVDMIILRAISGDIGIDTSYVSSYSAEIVAESGELPVIFKPSGTVYVKNNTADETPTYEVLIIGRT
jgi:hypothetical protein